MSPPSHVQARGTLNQDLESVINWGNDRLVTFNQNNSLVVCAQLKITLFSNSVCGLFTFAGTP